MVDYYNVGAYCAFFGFAVALPFALIIMSYFLLPGRNSRFYIALFFEMVATALGCAYFAAFWNLGKTASDIAYAILVMICVNLLVSLLDAALRFRRPIHSFHLLLAHACLWVGCIATVAWYRDYTRAINYVSWEAWSFIAMWCGAMIAIAFPPLIDYLFFYRGYLVPDDNLVSVTKGQAADNVTPGNDVAIPVSNTRTKEVAQDRAETSPLRGTQDLSRGDQVARDQTTMVNEGDFENRDSVKLHTAGARS
jgi:hypothetical protein